MLLQTVQVQYITASSAVEATITALTPLPSIAPTAVTRPSTVLGLLSYTTTAQQLMLPPTKTLITADNSEWRTAVGVGVGATSIPSVVVKPCDTKTTDYCFTAAAGITALLFLSLFFNTVLLAMVISMKRKKTVTGLVTKERRCGTSTYGISVVICVHILVS